MTTIAPCIDCENCTSAGSVENGTCQVCLVSHLPVEDFSLLETLLEHDIDPETFLRRVDRETIQRALHALRPTTQLLVGLIDVIGVSRHRAAELLGLTSGQTRELLTTGRKRFRRALWEEASRSGLIAGMFDRRRVRVDQPGGISSTLG